MRVPCTLAITAVLAAAPLAPGASARTTQTAKVTPLAIDIQPRQLRARGIRYRLSGRIVLPAGVDPSRCAGGHVVIRIPTRTRGRNQSRFARVGADCRFAMRIPIPPRYRGGFVRLLPLFRGGTELAPLRGRPVTLRPR